MKDFGRGHIGQIGTRDRAAPRRLAAATGRTKAYYLREMIERGIEEMEDVYLAQKTLEDVRAGRETTSSLDDVETRLGLAD
jgi:RHH-type rel operon transcriptional repressor/antitoxin RelB